MIKRSLVMLLLSVMTLTWSNEPIDKTTFLAAKASHTPFRKPSQIDETTWQNIQPYLLPLNHPVKKHLDRLFNNKHYTYSLETLEKGGFQCTTGNHPEKAIIAKHLLVKDYILKIYTDDQLGINELDVWIKRIEGANYIRNVIRERRYEPLLKVPQKWLYPLPHTQPGQKAFILVVEDMKILRHEENYEKWHSFDLPSEYPFAVYEVILLAGLNDSVYIDNIPFCKDNKVAFIDTEHYNNWPIDFSIFFNVLDKKKQKLFEMISYTDYSTNDSFSSISSN
ncbi:hypothetical protein BN1013_02224 [Candidatus Rubidus massiliensis]|nr:hypothetical protein BN1013_02224 [Candidatus Rubidus massiliensis]